MKIRMADFIYCAFMIMITMYYILKYTVFSQIAPLFIWLSLFLYIIKIITGYYKRKELIVIVLFNILGMYTFLITGEASLLLSCVLIAGLKNVDIHKVFKLMMIAYIVTLVIIVMLSFLGYGLVNYSLRNGKIRYAFGFSHPNRLALNLFIISQLCILKEKVGYKEYIIFIAINGIAYMLTDSRTPFVLSILTLIFIITDYFISIRKVISYVYLWIFPVLMAVVYIGTLNSTKMPWKAIDIVTSSRFTWNGVALKMNDIKLFPQTIYQEGILDCSYIALLLKMGIVISILYWMLYVLMWKNQIKKLPIRVIVLFIIMAIYATTEDIIMIIVYSPVFLYFSMCLFDTKEIKLKEEEIYEI